MSRHALAHLSEAPEVVEAVARARAACEELRWHRGLRRGWAVARTETGIRCARAGGLVDGLRFPVAVWRDVARGAAAPPAGPAGGELLGRLRIQAEVERLMPAPGAPRTAQRPLGQLTARLHAAAVGTDPRAGRPRGSSQPEDLRGLGPAPTPAEVAVRTAALAELVDGTLPPLVPGLVRAAVVLGELLVLRPFERANGPVARGVFRHLLTRDGVDPVGVVVPDLAWGRSPELHLSQVARYATGQGVAAWVVACAEAVVLGAAEGGAVADAVLAGRLEHEVG